MDFGSAVCTAMSPLCTKCPVYADCKSKGECADEKPLREKKRQSPFIGSNRWWRGQILKALTADSGVDEQALFSRISSVNRNYDEVKFRAALAQLKREGLVAGKVRLEIRG